MKEFLASEWEQYQPFTQRTWYRLNDGERRELFRVPPDLLSRWHTESLPLPFSNVYAAWLYAERCGEWDRVLSAWPSIRASFDDFVQPDQKDGFGTIFANRYLASLIALSRIAEKSNGIYFWYYCPHRDTPFNGWLLSLASSRKDVKLICL